MQPEVDSGVDGDKEKDEGRVKLAKVLRWYLNILDIEVVYIHMWENPFYLYSVCRQTRRRMIK